MASDTHRILCLNANRKNLEVLREFIQREGYDVVPAQNLNEMESALNENTSISLALIDLTGLSPDVWRYCEMLRQKGIAFLIISPRQIKEIERESIRHGAKGLLVKPLIPKHLMELVEELLEG